MGLLDPGSWAGRGAPPSPDLLPQASPLPQFLRLGLVTGLGGLSVQLVKTGQQGTPKSLLSPSLRNNYHPFAPKAMAIKREMVWATVGGRVSAYWCPQTPLCCEFANGNRLLRCRAGAGVGQESDERGPEAKWPRISDNFAGKAGDLD